VVHLVVAEIEVETQVEVSLCPTEEVGVAPLKDDVAMLRAEVVEVPQDDRRTFHSAANTCCLSFTV